MRLKRILDYEVYFLLKMGFSVKFNFLQQCAPLKLNPVSNCRGRNKKNVLMRQKAISKFRITEVILHKLA